RPGLDGPGAGGGRRNGAGADAAGLRLVALLTVGQPRDLLQGRRVIESQRPVDPARLADPGVPVRAAVAG
ncbi:MAG: hypothetical protein J2P34_04320, partial [Actinobacteria bacterium]|nr:hypothetical protein [Actinomycetota bacterium]